MNPPPHITAPYPGLRPFERHEDLLFFGREEQVDQLLDKLGESHFLAVLGLSGSGKSSLVKAGLLPALEGGALVGAGARWQVAEFRPGDGPIGRLAESLREQTPWGRAAPETLDELAEKLRRGSQALNWLLGVRPLEPGHRLLVLVDQFEELFRFQNRTEAGAFVALLLAAASHPDCYIIITMRSEFLGACGGYPDLAEAINAGLFLTPALTPEQLADAIEFPLGLPQFAPPSTEAGNAAGVEPELVHQLLKDAQDITDPLPLLQHALLRLWERHKKDGGGVLTLADYRQLGGLQQALNDHLEKAFEELDGEGKRVAEVMFRALVDHGGGRDTRRPTPVGEIARLAGVKSNEISAAAEPFRRQGRSFLMPPTGQELTPDTTLDITHEALIRQWQRLEGWSASEGRQADLYRRLAGAARRKLQGQGSLWIDPDLQNALDWRAKNDPKPAWAERYGGDFERAMAFLDESLAQRQRLEAREREHQEKLRRITQERTEALFDSALTHAALLARVEDPREGRRVLAGTVELDGAIPAPRRHARNLLAGYLDILGGAADKVYQGAGAVLIDLARSPDGRLLVAAGERGTLALFHAESGELIKRLTGHDPRAGTTASVRAVRFNRTGDLLYSTGDDGQILRWSMPDGERVGEPWQAPADVVALTLSPDGKILASGNWNAGITLWSTTDGEKITSLQGTTSDVSDGNALAFTPHGRLLSGGFKGDVGIWELPGALATGSKPRASDGEAKASGSEPPATGGKIHPGGPEPASTAGEAREIVLDRIHTDQVTAVAVDPKGEWLATGGGDKRIVLWRVTQGGAQPVRLLQGHANKVMGLRFVADGKSSGRLLSASHDNTMRLWDMDSGAVLRIFQGHTAGLWSIALDEARGRIYTAANDGLLRRWPLATPHQWLWEMPGSPISAAIHPSGRLVSVGFADGALRLYPLPTANVGAGEGDHTHREGEAPAEPPMGDAIGPFSARQEPRPPGQAEPVEGWGKERTPTPAPDAGPRAMSLQPEPIAVIEDAHGAHVIRQSYSPDGRLLATASLDHTAKLWRMETTPGGPSLTPRHTFDGHSASVHAVAFSPDGRTLATAGYDGKVGLYDVESGKPTVDDFKPHEGLDVNTVSFGGKETLLTVGDRDLRLWDLSQSPPKLAAPPLESRDAILWATLRPDARQLAAVGRDQFITLHGLPAPGAKTAMTDPSPRQLVGHEQTVYRAEYTPDGAQLATVSWDMTLRLWDLGNDKPLFSLRLPAELKPGTSQLWDFALGCPPAATENTGAGQSGPDAGHCWLAVPLTVGRLALYRLPYAEPPLGAR
uniref:WD40 repeat n=1 Tax=Candidatus Kentrum sp. FM TaxID=2126340 RepID=A0A450WBE8_9GAMM|nr:MAG: WD40 repeat [Candidatus Kentron sp. FM]VFJ62996.1 MAG: WD40 repeat [Candidatus Kentron sp. FM]VFK14335.1 MAG: WD40 repeat [Candidatus Kentron sp. FM]